MKHFVLDIVDFLLTFYFYLLLFRFILDFVYEPFKKHPISKWVYYLTKPVVKFLHRYIPYQTFGQVKVDIGLLLLILFYRFFLKLVHYIFDFLLI